MKSKIFWLVFVSYLIAIASYRFIIIPLAGEQIVAEFPVEKQPYSSFQLYPYANQFVIALQVNDHTALFIIDTGSEQSVFDSNQTNDYDIISIEQKGHHVVGVDGKESQVNLLAGYRITDFLDHEYNLVFKSVNLAATIKNNLIIGGDTIKYQQGLLGADFLKKYNAVIDYKNLTLKLYK